MESVYFNERGKYRKFSLSHRLKLLEKKFKKDGGKFKEYKIHSDVLFNVEGTKSLDEGKLSFVPDGINFVGRVNENNGIKGKIRKRTFSPNEENTITATVIGNYKYVKFQEEEYYCSQNINKLVPNFKINKFIAMYLIPHIQRFVSKYDGQQGGYKLNELKEHIIILPTKNNQIDFTYMENYIHVLEEERIHVLEAYLKVSELDTCKLTIDEENLLSKLNNKEIKFKKFNITGLDGIFDVNNTHSIIQSSIVPNSGKYPYVTAGESNNSVDTYISYNTDMLEKGNSIMIGGKTLVITYQEQDYFSNDSHNLALYLRKKEKPSQREQLFLISMLYKSLKPKYTWGDSISKRKIQTESFYLPVTQNDEIDYPLMETYIRAIEKKVIKNVVDWKDAIIKKTKELIV